MKEKRPIDKKRESAGMAEIGTKEDGAIVEMVKIAERLLIVKEKSIYEFIMADEIDPGRTNIGLPNNIQRKIIDQGTESELVCRTFLTAKTLFKPEFIIDTVDLEMVLTLALNLTAELIVLQKESNELIQLEQKETEVYNKRKEEPHSYAVPTIVDLESRCKSIFQKADHLEQILIEIVTNFYPDEDLTKQSHFPKFHEVIVAKYGVESGFARFIQETLPFMKIIRSLRNALDHRLRTVKIVNFDLQPDSQIISPTIELNHKEEILNRTSITDFVDTTVKNYISIIEITFAYLAGHNSRNFFLGYQIKEIPEERRQNKYVRYCFWSEIGQDGYYNQ